MSGVFIVAGVISTANNALREWDTLLQKRTRHLREILGYLKSRNTDPKLIREVLEYYQYCYQHNVGDESGAHLIESLPPMLQERLIINFYQFCVFVCLFMCVCSCACA